MTELAMERTERTQDHVSNGEGAPYALLVDDEPAILRALARALKGRGFQVATAGDGLSALRLVATQDFDVVVTDLTMPGMDGLTLTERIRETHAELPIILITGGTSADIAIRAVECGARKTIRKPIDLGELHATASQLVTEYRVSRVHRDAIALAEIGTARLDHGRTPEDAFTRALSRTYVAYQPVVDVDLRRIFGFEALLRCHDAAFPRPGALLAVAESSGRVPDLERVVHKDVALVSQTTSSTLFVNLHPRALDDDDLLEGKSALQPIAKRVVLEFATRASLAFYDDLPLRIARLKALGFRVGVDDLGACPPDLALLATLAPNVVKFDTSVVRGVHEDPAKQSTLRELVEIAAQVGATMIAEGVESEREMDFLRSLDVSLMQGHLFARAGAPLPHVTWPSAANGP
ncbi:MAG: EAL domain-containing protein [Polyangiaceae bacterium]